MKTKCGYCKKEGESEYPKGWFALLGHGIFREQFCSYECLSKFVMKHKNHESFDENAQWVRWAK